MALELVPILKALTGPLATILNFYAKMAKGNDAKAAKRRKGLATLLDDSAATLDQIVAKLAKETPANAELGKLQGIGRQISKLAEPDLGADDAKELRDTFQEAFNAKQNFWQSGATKAERRRVIAELTRISGYFRGIAAAVRAR